MTNQQIDEFYESLAHYYRRNFRIRSDNNVIKKGILCLFRRKDFNFELVCSKDYIENVDEEDKNFTLTFPLPFSFDHDENSILLDYRIVTVFKNRDSEITEMVKKILTGSSKCHRFIDKIIEIEFS